MENKRREDHLRNLHALAKRKRWIITDKSPVEVMRDIASQPSQEDPFYILDVQDIIFKVHQWKQLMPRVEIFYAVKCNDEENVLDILSSLGTGFDCSSKYEIQKVLDTVPDPSRIIYAHPCKSISDIEFASSRGISLMTFDCQEELHKVKLHYPQAELVLRIRSDASAATYSLGRKYGAKPEDSPSLLRLAKDLDLNLVGVSFHVGSDCKEFDAYRRAIAAAKQVFDDGKKLGMKLRILDIGGGFPGKTDYDLQPFALVINSALDTYFPNASDGLKIIAETGRYVVTSAYSLATKIRAKKTEMIGNRNTAMYYVNDGIYGSFSNNLFENELFSPKVLLVRRGKGNEAEKEVKEEKEEMEEKEEHGHDEQEGEPEREEAECESVVWGPTCCSLDVLKRRMSLPRLECEDWLYWPEMGAYTISNSSHFNGFPKPSVHVMMASPDAFGSTDTNSCPFK